MLFTLARYYLKLLAAFFFQEVETVGRHLTPSTGPVILCGNHSNQFVDPVLIISQCKRQPSFLMAASSMKKKVVGSLARMMHVIPVKRPQDYVTKGTGTITYDDELKRIIGTGTRFVTEVHPGDSIKCGELMVTVKSVENDTVVVPMGPAVGIKDTQFKIMPKIDQHDIYEAVQTELRKGGCVGIFPEGGSHDRPNLLPLKAGVCLMALGAMSRYNITVTIQCVGLNYYQGHRFRSKAVVNFGVPYAIPRELASLYLRDRKRAVEILLKQIENRLGEVWVTAPTYDELSHVFMARRVYKPDHLRENPALDMEMNIKFAKGYKELKEKYSDLPDFKNLVQIVESYSNNLKKIGLQDYQLRLSNFSSVKMILYTLITLIRIFGGLTISLPGWLVAGLMGVILNYVAEKERKKALLSSSVKLNASDTVASTKIVYGMVLMFLFTLFLQIVAFIYSYYLYQSFWSSLWYLVVTGIVWPIYMYFAIILSDRALSNFGRLYSRALSICSPREIENLKSQRAQLKDHVVRLVNEHGPKIFPGLQPGDLFKEKATELDDMLNGAFNLLNEIGL